ncbi:MAG TPA: hypothetical protein VEU29_08655 [Actinomycetota bacterium]|nr:hypothetical protein [Actinomycetota bacterium]
MLKNKLAGVAAAALVAVPLAAAPAQAQNCSKINEPYRYPCEAAADTLEFAVQEVNDATVFVGELRYEIGELAVEVVCTVFPENCL